MSTENIALNRILLGHPTARGTYTGMIIPEKHHTIPDNDSLFNAKPCRNRKLASNLRGTQATIHGINRQTT
jgi:hypothetical protein